MRSTRRHALHVSLGTVVGIGLAALTVEGRLHPGILLGACLAAALGAAFAAVDGPLEKRRAALGALVLSTGLVAAALWTSV